MMQLRNLSKPNPKEVPPDRLPESQKVNWVGSIFGQKGSGKSFLARQIAADEQRVLIIDNMGEYLEADVIEGFQNCVKAMVQAEGRASFRLALRARSVEEDLKLLYLAEKMTHITIIVDETSKYVSASYLPPEFEQLIRYGRHKAINQLYMSRRPSEIHRELTAQSDFVVTFRQHENRDIQYLRGRFGDSAFKAANLGQYQVMVYGSDAKLPWPVLSRKYENA